MTPNNDDPSATDAAPDPEHVVLPELDQRARHAAAGLRQHVLTHLEDDDPASVVAAARHAGARRRVAITAAAAVALIAGVTTIGNRGSDGLTRVENPEPGELALLGPSDGRDSVRLPVTVTPNVDLTDGAKVAVRGEGFKAGEQVGIVQCTVEAAGDPPEAPTTRGAGISACSLTGVVLANADASGVAEGEVAVRRVLTSDLSGTVDCAASANRCIVAMGAVDDYDRSGGLGLTFVGGGEPIAIPTATVEPANDLSDGEVVRVTASGFEPNAMVDVSLCTFDPVTTCHWLGASEPTAPPEEVLEEVLEVPIDGEDGTSFEDVGASVTGFFADGNGNLDEQVRLWRFLPGAEAGTYADCARTGCTLHLRSTSVTCAFAGECAANGEDERAPTPVPLTFAGTEPPPQPPAVGISPDADLHVGDEVLVHGAGFEPGDEVSLSLCARFDDGTEDGQAGGLPPQGSETCLGFGDSLTVDGDGKFQTYAELPELSFGDQAILPGFSKPETPCDDVDAACTIVVDVYRTDDASAPVWRPAPLPVTIG